MSANNIYELQEQTTTMEDGYQSEDLESDSSRV